MNEKKQGISIGIDVGGTAIKAGLVESGGAVLHKTSIATEAPGGPDHVLSRIAGLVEQMRGVAGPRAGQIAGVGIGVPGRISHTRGLVLSPPNLPGWKEVPVVDRLQKATGLAVRLDNDAKNAAFGEYHCGAGRGAADMVMLTLGTGVGGALITRGRIYRGSLENAGELGHMIVQPAGRRCNCGQLGCLEAYASAIYTAARARERVAAGESTILSKVAEIDSKAVVEAVQAGDAVAQQVWDESCKYLAIACINIQHALNPEIILFAGGMSYAGEALRRPVLAWVEKLCSRIMGPLPDVRLATLGNDAGFIGAALNVFYDD